MFVSRKYLGYSVLTAARARIAWTFHHFPRIYLSFSGGKDSTAMFHLCAEEAKKQHRKFAVLFIDWECQFQQTIEHIQAMNELYGDLIEPYWCCVPLRTVNSVSMFEPEWIAWEEGKEWVRPKPPGALTSAEELPFYVKNMTFEEFVPAFGHWYSQGQRTANFIGIRAQESLNRWRTVAVSHFKCSYQGLRWTTKVGQNGYNIYPIYDWKAEDIWTYFGKFKKRYNPLYDRFFQAGVSLRKMRICEPFGNEQRQGLDLFHTIEPETWGRLVARVNGANFGAHYAHETGILLGSYRISKPEGHSWESFVKLLLDSMPHKTAEHYRNKIAVYLHWWMTKGKYAEGIPDEQEKDLGSKDLASWRRICKCILRNDYWCKMLCFAPTKTSSYEKYVLLMKKKRSQWNLMN